MTFGRLLALVLALPVVALLALAWYVMMTPGPRHTGPLPALTQAQVEIATRLQAHVTAIASEPHNVRHFPALEKAARYIEDTLGGLGFRLETQPYPVDGRTVRNIWATIEPAGKGSAPASTFVVGAHYDSAGDAPGANDNGSGTAAVLEIARALMDHRPKRTRIILVLFTNEEPPYFMSDFMGSLRFANLMKERGEPVTGMISLETIGYFTDKPGSQLYPPPLSHFYPDRGNFLGFIARPGSRNLLHQVLAEFRAHSRFPAIGATVPGPIEAADFSDHWSFNRVGFPAIMVTDTAPFRYPHYHQRTDTPDKVDYERLALITDGFAKAIRALTP